MNKIIICMKDKNYSSLLLRALLEYYQDDYEMEIVERIEDLNEDSKAFYLTDQNLDPNINSLIFSEDINSKGLYKYQNVDYIIKAIEKHIKNKHNLSKAKLIGLINFRIPVSDNQHNKILADKCSKNFQTLILNFNNYIKFGYKKDEIGMEDLILSTKLKSEVAIEELVNRNKKFHYINSCINPFEMWKLSLEEWDRLINKLKHSFYEYVFYEVDFSFHPLILNLLRKSDHVIFYNLKGFSSRELNKAILDLTKKEYLKDNYMSTQLILSDEKSPLFEKGEDEKIIEFIK